MKIIIFCLVSLLLAVGVFAGIVHFGTIQFGQELVMQTNQSPHHMSFLADTLLALIVIVIVARVCGTLFKQIGQPPVMGEVIGGIILGPSVLGYFFPMLATILLPTSTMPYLNIIAQVGIVLYMFLVGLELDLDSLKKNLHETFIISQVSIFFPFILGSALALFIFKESAPPNVSFINFTLFIGVSMSITAFPVLARILADKKMTKTAIGTLALGCAAIDDVTAWCLLAFVAGRTQASSNNIFMIYGLCIFYILIMLFLVRPFLSKWIMSLNEKTFTFNKMSFLVVLILGSAFLTEALGIHAIFGAFLLGVIIPHNSFAAHSFNEKWQDIIRTLFLPVFFAYTGMKTQIGLLESSRDWILCLVIIAIAIIGKLGGTLISAKALKNSWRTSVILGVLMNTRGLVELIVLNVGLELGIITPRLFTMLVIMAVVTTFMTGSLLSLIEKFWVLNHNTGESSGGKS